MRVRQSACVLVIEIVLSAALATAQSMASARVGSSSPPQTASPPQVPSTSHCAALAQENSKFAPLSSLCQFAMSYRRNLPDFICEQTTTSASEPSRRMQTVMHARVTYEKGKDTYSDVTINGKPVQTNGAAPSGLYRISTAGEFGSDLVGLFTPPVTAEFSFRKEETLKSHPALLYEFHVPASKNHFWMAGSNSNGTFNPEVRGELWLQPQSARLLRMKIQPLHLPAEFPIATATTTVDYGEVRLGEAGDFLLPIRAETDSCLRIRGPYNSNCVHNVVAFANCRKFTARARIVGEPQTQPEESLRSPSASK